MRLECREEGLPLDEAQFILDGAEYVHRLHLHLLVVHDAQRVEAYGYETALGLGAYIVDGLFLQILAEIEFFRRVKDRAESLLHILIRNLAVLVDVQ